MYDDLSRSFHLVKWGLIVPVVLGDTEAYGLTQHLSGRARLGLAIGLLGPGSSPCAERLFACGEMGVLAKGTACVGKLGIFEELNAVLAKAYGTQ